MPKEEVPLLQLKEYLPENCFDDVYAYLVQYRVQLTVSKQRQSILGDYRHAHEGKPHRISVNGNLNPYGFLITLLHELAHLFTYERYGHRVMAHGHEWKESFSNVLAQFLQKKVFPPDVEKALMNTLRNPAASSCGDENLLRVLRHYDKQKANHLLVEQLNEGDHFTIKGGRIFRRGEKVRKRYKCMEIGTNKWFLFSAVYEVRLVNNSSQHA